MEIWDAYSEDGSLAGFDLVRGKPVPGGYFHLVGETIIRHADGDFLLVRRSFEKDIFPGKWEIGAGGSALKGENSLQAATREVFEETGISEGIFKELYRFADKKYRTIFCGYILMTNCRKDSVKLQSGETVDYKWIDADELIKHFHSDECPQPVKERLKDYINSIKNYR